MAEEIQGLPEGVVVLGVRRAIPGEFVLHNGKIIKAGPAGVVESHGVDMSAAQLVIEAKLGYAFHFNIMWNSYESGQIFAANKIITARFSVANASEERKLKAMLESHPFFKQLTIEKE